MLNHVRLISFKRHMCLLWVLMLGLPVFAFAAAAHVQASGEQLVEIHIDASSQVDGNRITQLVDSVGVSYLPKDDLPAEWAKTRFDNVNKWNIQNFAVVSWDKNQDAGYSENNGVVTFTDFRGEGEETLKELVTNQIHSGSKPILYFHGIPAPIAEGGYRSGAYAYNANPPSDYNKWYLYVEAVTQYLVDNFGIDEVSTWGFEFWSEPDSQLVADAETFLKTFDYWLAGLESVLGAGNVYAGTYFTYLGTPFVNYSIDHWGRGTNFYSGEMGTRISWVGTTNWVWSQEQMNQLPGTGGNFQQLTDILSYYSNQLSRYPQLKNVNINTYESGRGEPGIVVTWADHYGASNYAYRNDLYTQYPRTKNIINYGDWGTTAPGYESSPHVLTPAFNVYRIERDMNGQRQLPVSAYGVKANPSDFVGGYASASDEETNTYRVVAYNFNTDYDTNVSENVKVVLDNVPGTQVTIKEYLIDDGHNNWWKDWKQYRNDNDISYINSRGYGNYPSWTLPNHHSIYSTTDDVGFAKWVEKAPDYLSRQELQLTAVPSVYPVNDGKVEISRTLTGHSVLYMVIEASPTRSGYGADMGFENGSLSDWTTDGNVLIETDDKKDGAYSVKLSGISSVPAAAKQMVSGLVPGKRYTLTGWAKPEGSRMEYGIYVQKPGDTVSRIIGHGLYGAQSDWNRMAVTQEADENGQLEVGVMAPVQSSTRSVVFDTLRLQRSGTDSEPSLEPAPVGEWQFNAGSGTQAADTSGYGHNGTIAGASWITGINGNALNFDGTSESYVDIADANINIGSNFTLAAWVKAPRDRGTNHVLLAKGPKDAGHYELYIGQSDGKFKFYAPDLGGFNSETAIDDNEWHHVAVTYQGNTIKMYVDGALKNSVPASGVIVDEMETLRLGAMADGSSPIKGALDEVSIYNRELNATQIATLHKKGNGNLIGEWKLNDSSGTNAADTSGYGHHGTIAGATWTTGKSGNALKFDGTSESYVDIANADINIGSNFTLAAWVKAPQAREENHVLLAKGPKDAGHFELYIGAEDGELKFYAPDLFVFSSGTAIDDNKWHHVAVTYQGDTIKFYVDGEIKNTVSASGAIADEIETLRLGALVDGSSPFKGVLAEVELYSWELNQTDISALFQDGNGNLIGEWKLNEGSGTYAADTSGYGYNGTIAGASWITGINGNALSFDGTSESYVNIADADINIGSNFTLAAMVKAPQARETKHVFLAKGSMNAGHYELYMDESDGQLKFYAPDLGEFSSETAIDDNEWHHVAVTYQGDTIRFYIDGVLKNSVSASGTVADGMETLRLGTLADGSLPFKGALGEVSIYNRELSPAQIAALHKKGNGYLIGEWKFNAGSGTHAADTSGYGHHGTITGASWITGIKGNALNFDGTGGSYVEIADSDINIGSNFTLTAWVKAPQARETNHVLLAKGPKDTGHFELYIGAGDGELKFYAPDLFVFSSGTAIDDNEWHHVAVTYQGDTIKFYVDGVLKNTVMGLGAIAEEIETLRLGTLADGSLPFKGALDEVSIYGRELSQAEITALTVISPGTASNEKDITSFSLVAETGAATINATAHTVAIEVAYGTNLNSLVGTFGLSAGAAAKVGTVDQVSGTTANDFTTPVTYVVKAADGSTQNWTVTVSVAAFQNGNLIGEWKLNEGSGTNAADTSGYGHHGTIAGASWITGIKGNALNFDGTSGSYVEIADSDINIGSNFTLAAWVKAPQDRETNHVLLAKGPKDAGHFELYIGGGDGELKFYAPDIFVFSSGTAIDDNEWHHVAVTYQGDTIKFYVDGVLKNTVLASGAIADEIETLRLGTLADGTFPFKGALDEVSIYSRELSQAEITALTVISSETTSNAKDITSFSLVAETGAATINATEHTVAIEVAYGTNLNSLVGTFELSAGAAAKVGTVDQVSGTTANDFTTPVTYVVKAADGSTQGWTVTVTVKAAPPIGGGSTPPSGGGPTPPGNTKTSSTDGKLTLPAGKEGEVSLDNVIVVSIPANAADKELKVTIDKVMDAHKLLTNNEVLVTSVYEILKNFPDNFMKLVTLTFKFDPASLKNNQSVAVFYYDETKKSWVEVAGGKVSGNHISVTINHFTKFAVFAVDKSTEDQSTDVPTSESSIKLSDIAGHWAEAGIKQAVSNGIIAGYLDGTFKPNQTVTRAEFTVMLMNTLKPQGAGAALTFTDAAKIGTWAKSAVAQAVKAGYIKGYQDGTFRPEAAITRAEMAMMIANALGLSLEENVSSGFADDKDIPDWAKGAVAAIKKSGYIEGKGSNKFDPNAKMTRAEAVTVLLKLLEPKEQVN